MKKFLLSAAAIMAAMTMNAQEVCTFNAENVLGLDADNGTALTAGTVIGETASIVATIGADDTYKPQSVKATAGDTEIDGGLQGATNPKDEDGASSNTTLKVPVSGAFLQFEAKADGFLYVIHKASSNKAYTVFEEGEAIGYTFAAIGNKDPLPEVYEFTLAGAGEYNWLKEAGITSVEFAEQEYLKATDKAAYDARWAAQDDGTTKWTNISAGGIGVIKFPVFADCKYVVNASGSKITAGGFVFSTEDNVTIKSGDVTIIGEGGTTPVVEEKVYSIIGTLVGNWDVDTDLTKNESGLEGLYETVFENVAAGSYEVKFRQDHDWKVNWGVGGAQDGDNIKVEVEKDGSQVVVLFDPATGEYSINVVAPGEPAGDILSLIDKFTGCWNNAETATANADGTITYNAKQWGGIAAWLAGDTPADYSAYDNIVFEFAEATPCAVQGFVQPGNGGENKLTWIDAGTTKAVCALGDDKAAINQIALQCAEDATLTITRIYLEKADASAINAVKAAAQDSDAIYNIAGQKVSASYKGLVIKNGKKYIQK